MSLSFEQLAANVQNMKNKLGNDTLLKLYALYQQATVGDVQGSQPSSDIREAIFPSGRQDIYTSYKYSAAIKSGDLLFASGQVGSRSDGTPEPDYEAEVRLAFTNLKSLLHAAGCTYDDIIDVTTFHTDPEKQFDTMMKVKAEIFTKPPYPNWTAVGVNWLAGFRFEIKVIARIPQPAQLDARTKWDAWNAQKGKSCDTAKTELLH